MSYKLKFPWEYKYNYHLSKNDDGTKNGSIFYEKYPGHAYCMAKQPKFGDDTEWEEFSKLIIDAVYTYQETGLLPSEILEKFKTINGIVGKVLDKIETDE